MDRAGAMLVVGVCAWAAAARPAHAQGQAQTPSQAVQSRPVEAGKADVDPLSTSQKLEPIDLRVPTGFDRVYELRVPPKGSPGPLKPGPQAASPGTASDRWFVRQSGALAVVFKRSVYTPTPQGLFAELPPGAIFGIGGVTPTLLAQIQSPTEPGPRARERALTPAQQSSAASPLRAQRANLAAQPARPANAGESSGSPQGQSGNPVDRPSVQPPSIWSDESYRRTRLSELIDRAVRPEPKRAEAGD